MTQQQLNEMRQRNAQRLVHAKEKLGDKWLLHPVNHVRRKPVDLGVLRTVV